MMPSLYVFSEHHQFINMGDNLMAAEDQDKNNASCSCGESSNKQGFKLFGSKVSSSCSNKGKRNSCATGNCPSGTCSTNNTLLLVVIAAVMLLVAYRTRSQSEDVSFEASVATQETVAVDAQEANAQPKQEP